MRTPQGMRPADFAAALTKFARVVGTENVYTEDADVDLYRDAYSILWGEPDERIASAAVAPKSVEEVQAIVRVANEHRVPLYAVSTGRNLGYGGSAPAWSGSVVVDLKRMNRVIEVNEAQRYCILEPGVSFLNLWAELERRKIKLKFSMPAPGWGSPIGNALDHGHGGPAGSNFRNACGLEVVLGNGQLVRTGIGAIPNGKTWATFPDGVGPTLDGMFAQSNFGIVTKMGFNLFPWPETSQRVTLSTRRYDDLDAMVDICAHLQAIGVGTGSAIFSPLHEALAARGQEPKSGSAASEFDRLAAEFNADLFLTSISVNGPEKMVRAQVEVAQERMQQAVPEARVTLSRLAHAPADHASATEADRALIGKPTLARFWEDTAQYDWDGHLWFSPLLPQTGAEIRKAYQVFGDICRRTGVFFGLPDVLLYNSTALGPASSCYCLVKNFNVSKSDKEYNRRTLATVKELIRAAGENGWSEYRGAPALQQSIMDQLSFNDHAYMKLCESIKDAVDPNGILSAGRYAIWPRHLRKTAGRAPGART